MSFVAGSVIWILLVLAIVAIVTFFERFFDLHRSQIDYEDFLKGVINVLDRGSRDEAIAICEDTPAPVASVVATAIRHQGRVIICIRVERTRSIQSVRIRVDIKVTLYLTAYDIDILAQCAWSLLLSVATATNDIE